MIVFIFLFFVNTNAEIKVCFPKFVFQWSEISHLQNYKWSFSRNCLEADFVLIAINDLKAVVQHSKIVSRISKKTGSQEDSTKLQEDLKRVMKESTENNMQLHRDKFELLVHRYKPNDTLHVLPFIAECTSYKISDDITLYPSDNLRDLGVTAEPNLSWSQHISKMAIKGRSWIFSVFTSRDKFLLITLYKSYIIYITYIYQKPKSSVVWVGETWLLFSFQKLWNIRSQGKLIY